MALIEVKPTALAWSMTLTLTLTFNSLRAMVMTYSHAKVQGQQSVGSKDRVETNGRIDRHTHRQMEATALSPSIMQSATSMKIRTTLWGSQWTAAAGRIVANNVHAIYTSLASCSWSASQIILQTIPTTSYPPVATCHHLNVLFSLLILSA